MTYTTIAMALTAKEWSRLRNYPLDSKEPLTVKDVTVFIEGRKRRFFLGTLSFAVTVADIEILRS